MCSNCGVNMGEYFCVVCRFYDDDVKLMIYELSDCFRFDLFFMPYCFCFFRLTKGITIARIAVSAG